MNRIIIAFSVISCALAQNNQTINTAAAGNPARNATSPLNIEDLGAKGDGKTDNSPAITAAVTAACASGQPMLIPVGTFVFSKPISVSCAHFELRGTSRFSSRLRYSGEKTTAALTLSKINNPTVSNLTVDADGRADYSIQLLSTHRGMFTDINVRNCIVSCFYTNFSVGDTLQNIAVSTTEERFTTTPQNGIALDGTTTASILNNVRVDGVRNAGIYLGKAATIIINGGLLEANAYGIYSSPSSEDSTVVGTDIECNSTDNVILLGSRITLSGILSSDGGHCANSETLIQGQGNVVYGGHFVDLTVGASAKGTTLIGASYQTGAVAHNMFRDLGTGTQYTGLINITGGGAPHSNRLNAPLGIGREPTGQLDQYLNNGSSSLDHIMENAGGGQARLLIKAGTPSRGAGSQIEFYDRKVSETAPRWTQGNNYGDDASDQFCFIDSAGKRVACFTQSGHILAGANVDNGAGTIQSQGNIVPDKTGTWDLGTAAYGFRNVWLSGTLHTTSNCFTSASPSRCGSAPTGSVVIPAGSKSIEVDSTAVTADSQIIVTVDASLGARLGVTCNVQPMSALGFPRVIARRATASFTVAVDAPPAESPLCFSYTIVN